MTEDKYEFGNEQCPVCGYYCLGKGGHGCIDKPFMFKQSQAKCESCYSEITDKIKSPVNHLCNRCYEDMINSKCPCSSGKKFKDCHMDN